MKLILGRLNNHNIKQNHCLLVFVIHVSSKHLLYEEKMSFFVLLLCYFVFSNN